MELSGVQTSPSPMLKWELLLRFFTGRLSSKHICWLLDVLFPGSSEKSVLLDSQRLQRKSKAVSQSRTSDE
eukprot:3593979-Karenia_brevis.AAC.1